MKILLLGNGFDLYHKFPTRYDNFLHTVDFLRNYYDENTMKTIGDILGDSRLADKDNFIPYCYETYKNAYDTIKVDKEKIKQIISLAKDNIWFEYFLSSYNKESGWIDFEKEIAKVIYAFELFFGSCDNIKNVVFSNEKAKEYILKKFAFFCNYRKSYSAYGIPIPENYSILNDYVIEEPFGSKNMIIDKTKIISKLYKELLKVTEILRLYLMIFVDETVALFDNRGLIIKNSIFKKIGLVITFNYTHLYEELYGEAEVCHIHGATRDKIVLGINPDESDEHDANSYADTDFLHFKKYYQRVLNRTDLGYLNAIKRLQLLKIRKTNNILYVAGHSLDVTDEDIIKEVFDIVDQIVIVCYNENAIADSINNLVRIYGKSEFDKLRVRTDLEFKLYTDFNEVD